MKFCVACMHVDDRRGIEHCANCGGEDFAGITGSGTVVALPAAAGMPCQQCLEEGHALRFRFYRRVTAFFLGASLAGKAGYFCRRCRWKSFLGWQLWTLVLGWWGILSFIFYNPWAVLINFWALFAAPLDAEAKGAIDANDVREAAGENERLEDLYSQLPTWFTQLSEEDLGLITSGADFYAVLDVTPQASDDDIRAAYRREAKRYHPDSGGPDVDADQMAALNEAHHVLGSPVVRYAYDHVDELFASVDESADEDVATEPADDVAQPSGGLWRCRFCDYESADFDDVAEHADRAHPEVVAVDPRANVLSV
jgi:hypothetical protein